MTVEFNKKKCMYCGACVSVCPQVALNLKETWVDVDEKCVDCGICVKLCPVGAISLRGKKND